MVRMRLLSFVAGSVPLVVLLASSVAFFVVLMFALCMLLVSSVALFVLHYVCQCYCNIQKTQTAYNTSI